MSNSSASNDQASSGNTTNSTSKKPQLADLYDVATQLGLDIAVFKKPPTAYSSEWKPIARPAVTFLGIPIEIRNIIYKLLLVNPVLGTRSSVLESEGFGYNSDYDLSPAVLGVNKQVHDEAMKVLYGSNSFYFVPLRDGWIYSGRRFKHLSISPLTRYCTYIVSEDVEALCAVPAITKVRRWIVVIDIPSTGVRSPFVSLTAFCRAICLSRPRSLEVAIIPRGMLKAADNAPPIIDYKPIAKALQPLRLLCGIQRFDLRDADRAEVPYTMHQSTATSRCESHLYNEAVLQVDLTTSIQSNGPVDLLFMMLEPLQVYAQAFESCDLFKDEMIFKEDYVSKDRPKRLDGPKYFNPFRGKSMHPVEKALVLAQKKAKKDDIESFKEQRSIVLEYLEPQYKRICAAADNMVHLIKEEKRPFGIFAANYNANTVSKIDSKKRIAAMVLLEQYAASFQRDTPFEVKTQIRRHQRLFDSIYATDERNIALKRLSTQVDFGDFRDFAKDFETVFNSFDSQFLEVLKARKCLFKYDGPDRSSWVVDPELSRSDEPTNWEIDEPEIFVEPSRKKQSRHSYKHKVLDFDDEDDDEDADEDEDEDED